MISSMAEHLLFQDTFKPVVRKMVGVVVIDE